MNIRKHTYNVHLLFFDGGSRGNPGPRGSGACVLCVDVSVGSATVGRSASMSHARKSATNNQAEYHGLLAGLRAGRLYR
jgi:ribonuclease HI